MALSFTDPLTPVAAATVLPSAYQGYSRLVQDALGLEQARVQMDQTRESMADRKRTLEQEAEARRAAAALAAELSQLDPSSPDYEAQKLKIIARNPESLYDRAAQAFLGISADASREAASGRIRQADQTAQEERDKKNFERESRRRDEAVARDVALKLGRRDLYDNYRLKRSQATTEAEIDALNDDLRWDAQQWDLEQKLIEAGLAPDTLMEAGPEGRKYLGKAAYTALIQQNSRQQQSSEWSRTMSAYTAAQKALADLRSIGSGATDAQIEEQQRVVDTIKKRLSLGGSDRIGEFSPGANAPAPGSVVGKL